MTQADIARTVKALVRTLTAAGLTVTGTKVSFLRGEPVIEVLTSGESTPPVQREASHVEIITNQLKERHAARRAQTGS